MITVLSYNLSLASPSHQAPPSWHKDEYDQRHALQKMLQSQRADILSLQEVPDPKWPLLIFPITHYIPLGSVPSHNGYTSLLVRPSYAKKVRQVYQFASCILALFDFPHHSLAVGSCHLPPFANHDKLRKELLESMFRFCEEQSMDYWIFLGDMNMRNKEEKSIENLPQTSSLCDAWKHCGHEASRWTFDGRINPYHPPPHKKITARFDRIYSWPFSWKPQSFKRCADHPLQNPKHFLSDHFGIHAAYPLPKHGQKNKP